VAIGKDIGNFLSTKYGKKKGGKKRQADISLLEKGKKKKGKRKR